MIKKLLLIVVLSTSMFAYKTGDTINEEVIKQLKLEDGKVYIVDFFASWCKSCNIELPLISKLGKQLDDKYEILGVNIDRDRYLANTYVAKLNLNFRVYFDNSNDLVSKFNPIGVPAIYYIKDKKVLKTVFGAVSHIDQKIKSDLNSIGE